MPISDGWKSFERRGLPGPPHKYEGSYRDGVRDGVWRCVSLDTGIPSFEVTWSMGEWHGPTRSWYRNGDLEHEGQYLHGETHGLWQFWFAPGNQAAIGRYAHDKKVGDWQYWDEGGNPMRYEVWAEKYDHWHWAFDDYTGFPRGENWPEPPPD